jgi:ferrochelatase
MKERRVPAIRVVPACYEHPAYLDAVVAVVRDEVAKLDWQPEHFLISFHGIPVSYVKRGDPYPEQVEKTTRGLLERLNWPKDKWSLTYQSRFGREPWLQPYTDDRLAELARQGIRKVFVVTPGFTSDCLETIDEIGYESREAYLHAGGEKLHQCACLNDHPAWIDALEKLVREEGQGWI